MYNRKVGIFKIVCGCICLYAIRREVLVCRCRAVRYRCLGIATRLLVIFAYE